MVRNMEHGKILLGTDALRMAQPRVAVTMDQTGPDLYDVRSIGTRVIIARNLTMLEARDFIRANGYEYRMKG